jgi:hypothetical protein
LAGRFTAPFGIAPLILPGLFDLNFVGAYNFGGLMGTMGTLSTGDEGGGIHSLSVAGFGIEDLLRQGVNVSVMNLREARICVRMVSGDNIETAKQAALKAGIITQSNLSDDDVCMTGEDLMAILGN